ncbi:solute carrier family 35 member F6-like [Ornithodoros turicata]|uniref:solute carrier family 35 member F6-like n=1 Tax=Ornithodoros turicata TaxID=34597 RepID=UPI00313892D4
MAWTKYQVFLALMLVFTGSINTLATKWADRSKSRGRDGTIREFDHPFLQAVGMFLGELSCLLAFQVLYWYHTRKPSSEPLPPSVSGSRSFNPFIFLPPAMCDLIATSIMYVGLELTFASSFQMLRGAVIIFTGLLSVAFLGRHLKGYEWLGILIVLLGLVVVGLSDMLFPGQEEASKGQNGIITGDLLIILAQVIAACQMVIEEKFVTKYNVPPLQAVGWEGFFGCTVLGTLLIPMYFIPVGNSIFKNPNGQLEDAIDGLYQISNSWSVCLGVIGTIVSIAFFNFAGISVTKELSATTRMVLDSVRTLVIWAVSLIVRWQKFSWIQLVGFFVLIVGMFLYNNVVIRPLLIKNGCLKAPEDDMSQLVVEESGDRVQEDKAQA